MPKPFELKGQRFGRLVVVGRAERVSLKRRDANWSCVCDCGASVAVISNYLTSGHTSSCGCLRKDAARERTVTHGKAKSVEWTAWMSMKKRCFNSNDAAFHHYGGRGITVHPSWEDFQVFYDHIGPRPSPRHSLDRIDVNGNYEPGNVRWATRKEQSNNRRCNRILEFKGEALNCAQWAERLGVSQSLLSDRLVKLGWSIERALTTPARKLRRA